MKLISVLICLICTFSISAQILTFEFSALGGAEATANSNFNDPSISASTVSRGPGLTAAGNGGRFNATGWALTSIANAVSGNNYMEFSITPNAGCNFSITSIQIQLQRSNTGPSAIALRSSLDGFATNLDTEYPITDNTTTQIFNFTFAQTAIASTTTFRIYMYAEATGGSGGIGDGAGNDIIVNGSTNCSAITNTLTINSLSSLGYNVDCITDAPGSVNITTTDVFSAGNIYSVQLSDASGSFASPTTIGSLASTSNGPLDINYSIPSGTGSGTGYRIRVISSSPAIVSADNGSDITITLTGTPCVLQPPHMTSVIINSCNPTCNEGFNEIVFGTSGGYSIAVNASNFNFEYGSNASPSANTNYTDLLVNNPARINELNTAAGCPGLFVDAVGTTIPPDASWLLAYTGICEEALDWTGLCGSGPIYVIFHDDSDWNTGGNFANNTSGMRYLNTTITTTSSNVFDIDYNFNGNSYSNNDGVYVTYDSNGGAPILYGDDDCMLEPVVLPIELYSFTGEVVNKKSLLNWSTLSEYNFSHFDVYHSSDLNSFYKIGTVAATGNSTFRQDYRLTHSSPLPGVNYYRLVAIDSDGSTRNHGIIALNLDIHFAYYDGESIVLHLPYSVGIYNLQGQLIAEAMNETSIPFQNKGVFFIREKNSGTTQRIVIQ